MMVNGRRKENITDEIKSTDELVLNNVEAEKYHNY